jgi:hypothetical protein
LSGGDQVAKARSLSEREAIHSSAVGQGISAFQGEQIGKQGIGT